MAQIIEARMQQKTDSEAAWNANPLVLLKGEMALVVSSNNTPINFKIGDGTKTFAQLPYWIQYGAQPKSVPASFSFAGQPAGLYIASENGTYNGNVTVNLAEGVNYLVWDGSSLQKIVYPIPVSGVATITGATNSLESIYLDSKLLNLGPATAGRYTTPFAQDTNTSYKKSDYIPVAPEWQLSVASGQHSNCVSVEFDWFKNPIRAMTWTAGVPFSLHPSTQYVRFSSLGNASTPVPYVVTVVGAISSSFRTLTDKIALNTENYYPKSDNVFDWTKVLRFTQLGSTGNISANAAGLTTTPLIPIHETGRYVINVIFNTINSWRIASYDENGVFIAYESFPSEVTLVDQMMGRYAVSSPATVPSNAKYIRFCFDWRTENTEEQVKQIAVMPYRAWRSMLANKGVVSRVTTTTIRDIIKAEKVIDNDLTRFNVIKFGDSITANLAGAGSWNIWFNGALNPNTWRSYASGGATLSSTEALFGDEYRVSGGNTFMKQCESVVYGIGQGTVTPPDVLIIMGGTNDFDVGRHVTPAEMGSIPYDEYMEQTFMTQSPTYNTLIPLASVNRGKVAGALRYIVERVGTVSPNTIFFICTPIQSTLHNQLNAYRTVRDIEWMSKRLNIPCINQWSEAGMPMLWDYGTDRRFLADRIHPFSDSGQTRGSAVMGRFMTNEFLKKFIPNV